MDILTRYMELASQRLISFTLARHNTTQAVKRTSSATSDVKATIGWISRHPKKPQQAPELFHSSVGGASASVLFQAERRRRRALHFLCIRMKQEATSHIRHMLFISVQVTNIKSAAMEKIPRGTAPLSAGATPALHSRPLTASTSSLSR